MHFQKSLTVFCVAACLGAASLSVRAEDTDIQAKAREALRQKMAELNGQTGQTTTPAAPAAPAVPAVPAAPATAAAPAVPAPATTATSSYTPGALTPEQEAKVREALRQAMAGQNAQQPVAPATVVVQPAVTTPAQPQPAVNVPEAAPQAPAVVSTAAPANPGAPHRLTAEEEQRVLEAERTELARLRTTDAKQNATADTKGKFTPVKSVATPFASPVPTTTTMTPAQGSKEQRLNQLLELYKADKITPVEYHQERAKILAE